MADYEGLTQITPEEQERADVLTNIVKYLADMDIESLKALLETLEAEPVKSRDSSPGPVRYHENKTDPNSEFSAYSF
jgi:hypothetical protein